METIGVVGAGTMGAGIAQGAAVGGCVVRLHDAVPGVAGRAVARIGESLARAVEKGKMESGVASAALARLRPAEGLADLAGCGLVVEAIVEDAAAKARLFSALSRHLDAGAVIATNTSSLRVDDLAGAVEHPERFLGLHYFFPAAINPLLEIVRGRRTGDAAMDRAAAFAVATGKRVVRCRDAFGFAVNRFFVPYLNEAARLVDEGIAPGEVEAVACAALATPAGPFRVMDLTKPVIALHACRTLSALGPFYQPAAALVRQGEAGGPWNVSPAEPAPVRAAQIAARLHGAILSAVLEALDDEVAAPDDFDLGARIGLQWGWLPCAAARAMGREAVAALVARYFTGRTLPASLGRIAEA